MKFKNPQYPFGLFGREDHILACGGAFTHSWGQVPFDEVPGLSSNDVRGYYSGRFRDDNEVHGNIEYRCYMTKNFGMALFADSGRCSIMPRISGRPFSRTTTRSTAREYG